MVSAASATGTTPSPETQTPLAEAIGEIKGRRIASLNEYKQNPGLFSFGGPRDSFRKDALSAERVKEDLSILFKILPSLTKDVYTPEIVIISDAILGRAEEILKQDVARPEERLAEIKKTIAQVQEAIKNRTS